ncbi:hypothetical protein EHI8A_002310 [Entamoeba histolytica HM-1:IMSS-B]|uniref:THH1/TOM1/TOM3 domain-containing protein n=6 Tax=Entamoeba histolytica TaxID=5759 RepID=C4M0Y2_ENTH1|nr:hypothetical protein EHI_134950 [Entamoeba histolytica HM-1:IMSS]EMD48593.1 Hypothetical protein EHI5A_009480 [Entamoeba histolytica KU27]EMH76432.1 hypothetical protein EHI8A_002310 [Entamoeba histolytica HM-1:IMSS-B]EMS14484.1 hypothetical protein KM1_007940 [Entamoeba histolytica HM-3:IMSS]ENY60596.1 hypothetical protein EHI7A_048060 [Entamoeba histolytica HM-1:IMSS-A]GAT94838.1 hypothetical protein CL6EHI_134950 [Entamoeba histolytica]|eukprot:XP_651671.1 hypothetical protein EHI_134950 [Entamoeba histolytica HM-1:IMSS]
MSEQSKNDINDYYDFPLQKLVIAFEYFIIAILCIIQSIRIVKNHHRFCGFQNLIILFALSWCVFRVVDLMIAFFLFLFSDFEKENSIEMSIQWMISDVPSFVMVAILSFVTYYYASLIHHYKWSNWKINIIVIILLLNFFHILSLSIIDIMLVFEQTKYLIISTFAFSGITYFILLVGLYYVSVRIFFINSHDLEQSHPSPIQMGIAGIIICLTISTRFIYDLISSIEGRSLLSLLCSAETPSSICENNFVVVTLFAQLMECVLMTLWEIIPLTCLIVLFWNIPKSKSYDPFPHFQNIQDDDSSESSLLTQNNETFPFIHPNK